MARRAKGPRLHLREREGRQPVYVILDRGRESSTGCGLGQLGEAERALEDYLSHKRIKSVRRNDPSQVTIDEVLALYNDKRAPKLAHPRAVIPVVRMLSEHAGSDTCDVINGDWCRSYVDKRMSGEIAALPLPGQKTRKLPQEQTMRGHLLHLSACLNFAVAEGLLSHAPKVTLPAAGESRIRFLTRDDAAKLLWTCWRWKKYGPKNQILYPLRHLCRFILVGIYTGTRSGAILTGSFTPGPGKSHVDLDLGVFFRLPHGRAKTKKRQPPTPIPDRLLAHMRRWQHRTNLSHVVTFNSRPVESIKKAFSSAVKKAGLTRDVTPHTLRHTFMTWVLTAGMPIYMAARLAGMSIQMADRTYGHLDPTHRDVLNDSIRGPKVGANKRLRARHGSEKSKMNKR